MNMDFFSTHVLYIAIIAFLYFMIKLKGGKEKKTVYKDKKDCECYSCLTSEGDKKNNCNLNCQPPNGLDYFTFPCKSCELRNWCYNERF